MTDELRLNALHRYRKTSSRLALEVHSHCEVPAGCGGVVLRWRSADEPVGVRFSLWTNARGHAVFVDGDALGEQRLTLTPGSHVLALQAPFGGDASHEPIDAATFRCLVHASLDPHIGSAVAPSAASAADGRWRMTVSAPPAGWQRAAFADDDWHPMVARAAPPASDDDWSLSYLAQRAVSLGAPDALLSAELLSDARSAEPAPAPTHAWVRWRFEVGAGGFS